MGFIPQSLVLRSIVWDVLLINRQGGHYREISDRGLDVLTERLRYIKAKVLDFPVMTERTRLMSYLLYGLFSAILKKNTIKTREVIFHIRLRALRLSSSLILKKYLYASFSFSYWKYSCILSIFSVVFAHAHVVLLTTQKSRRAESPVITYYLLTESEVITGKSQTEALMYWPSAAVWDFPVMTERTRLISYLLYGPF